jgi:hypothetical protein
MPPKFWYWGETGRQRRTAGQERTILLRVVCRDQTDRSIVSLLSLCCVEVIMRTTHR